MTPTHPLGLSQGHGMWQNLCQEVEPARPYLLEPLGPQPSPLPTQLTWEAPGFALGSKIRSCLSWKRREE